MDKNVFIIKLISPQVKIQSIKKQKVLVAYICYWFYWTGQKVRSGFWKT